MSLLEEEIGADDIDELSDFVVEDENEEDEPSNERILDNVTADPSSEEAVPDRMRVMAESLAPNETLTQRVLKAHISILTSALGGLDHTSASVPPPYKLGHDALACLKDIKRWIKLVDERQKTYSVAIACAQSGLLTNDLMPILCQWDSQVKSKTTIRNPRATERVMLACLELLVLLTWPTEIDPQLSEEQKLLFSDIKRHQVYYKAKLLLYNNGQALRAVVRLCLPAIAKERSMREPRDNAIVRLVLFLMRNILYIEPLNVSILMKARKQMGTQDVLPPGVLHEDISINSVLAAFESNKVLQLILTMLGNIGMEYEREVFGPVCLECLFLIIRGINMNDLFDKSQTSVVRNTEMNEQQADPPIQPLSATRGMQLNDLLSFEAQRKRTQTRVVPTRHSRFGSLLSIRSGDADSYVVSGQEALQNTNSSFAKMDRSKQWNARTGFKNDSDEYYSGTKREYLNSQGKKLFLGFIENILVGGCFNNIIENVGSMFAGGNDLSYIGEYEKACFFLTVAWFLGYKREKKASLLPKKLQNSVTHGDSDTLDYGSVGAALGEVNFILLVGYFRESFTLKGWSSLHVAMICFKELLLISYSLFGQSGSGALMSEQDEIDQELAEGIIRKLFSFSDFLNIIVLIPHTAAKHSAEYLTVCISVVHIVMKSFERFANEDLKVYVQAKKKRQAKPTDVSDATSTTGATEDTGPYDSDEDESAEAMKQVKRERKLDFLKAEMRLFATPTVTTYIEYLSRYRDLTHEEIKRCLSYFHRLFVVTRDFLALFRLDFMYVLQQLRSDLPRNAPIRKEVDGFIIYFMKKFKPAFARFPLPIEILFPRLESLECKKFLATGELEQAKPSKKKRSRDSAAPTNPTKELEFTRHNFTIDEKLKITVSALCNQGHKDFLDWLVNELKRIGENWSTDTSESGSDSLDNTAKFAPLLLQNSYIRLLLRCLRFQLPLNAEDPCTLPRYIEKETITEYAGLVTKWILAQPVSFEDGKDATFFVITLERESDLDSDGDDQGGRSDGENDNNNTEAANQGQREFFTELDRLDELEESIGRSQDRPRGQAQSKSLKKKTLMQKKSKDLRSSSQRRSRSGGSELQSHETQHRIVSAEWIHDSDDESDDERERDFFEQEERLRRMLPETGIVNAEQLEEFKKAWSGMGYTSNRLEKIVDKVMNNNGRPAGVSELETDVSHFGDADALQKRTKSKRKSRRIIEEEEEGDEREQEENGLEEEVERGARTDQDSAESAPKLKKRKTMVLSDEESDV